jgi:hypothetical protein
MWTGLWGRETLRACLLSYGAESANEISVRAIREKRGEHEGIAHIELRSPMIGTAAKD